MASSVHTTHSIEKIDNQLSGDEEKDKARRKPLIEELVR